MSQTLKCLNNLPLLGNSVAPPLVVGQTYLEIRRHTCHNCGQEHIDVGLKSSYNYISCYTCKEHLPDVKTHWCHPSRFENV